MGSRAPLITFLALSLLIPPAFGGASERGSSLGRARQKQITSLPGQISVVTINAKAAFPLDIRRFRRLIALVDGLRARPVAFNGGPSDRPAAPDVLVVAEMRASNAESFQRLLRQHTDFRYTWVGSPEAEAKFFINEATIDDPLGEAVTWSDMCTDRERSDSTPVSRTYQYMRFSQTSTGLPFVVAGVELAPSYVEGTADCLRNNMRLIRSQLSLVTDPTILAGDFNRRAVEEPYECDEEEQSSPLEWWQILTSTSEPGRPFVDVVRNLHRKRGGSMRNEWTHERSKPEADCTDNQAVRRSRIDYIFSADAVPADAHTDHPGWAGLEPGSLNPDIKRYSDHRFVWGRFALSDLPRPVRPQLARAVAASVAVSWQIEEVDRANVRAYTLFRGRRGHAYEKVVTLPADTLSYIDAATRHGRTYRYVITPVGAFGDHGVEGKPSFVTPDGRGPVVIGRRPPPYSTNIRRDVNINVRFDEPIDRTSVYDNTLRVFAGGKRVAGNLVAGERSITFDPRYPLPRKTVHEVVVLPVLDVLGNPGTRDSWTFYTTRTR